MNTWKNYGLTILTITLIALLLKNISTAASDGGLHNYFNYCLFNNIVAETSNADDVPPLEETSKGGASTEDPVEMQEKQKTADLEKQLNNQHEEQTNAVTTEEKQNSLNDVDKKKQAKEQKVEKIISDLPEKISATNSTFLRRFPLELNEFDSEDADFLKRQDGESTTAYRHRYNRHLSALCTAKAGNALHGSNWNLIIEDTKLCSISRAMDYEQHYLELAEKEALERGEYDKFLQTTDSEMLDKKRRLNIQKDNQALQSNRSDA